MKHTIFETKEQYLNAIQAWKDTCKDKSFNFQPEHFALYAIIRDKDPRKCFASEEQQSERKMREQFRDPDDCYNYSMATIKNGYRDEVLLAPFTGTLTKLQLIQMRDIWEEPELERMKLERMGVAI